MWYISSIVENSSRISNKSTSENNENMPPYEGDNVGACVATGAGAGTEPPPPLLLVGLLLAFCACATDTPITIAKIIATTVPMMSHICNKVVIKIILIKIKSFITN